VKVIGLAGRIGCGKSTVAALLRERRVATIDADEVAREVREEDLDARGAIVARFGTVESRALADIVFHDPRALADLEAIIHPLVRERVAARLAHLRSAGTGVAAVEAIKLLESPLRASCDQVWVVDCRPEDASRRLAERGLTAEEVAARQASQMSRDALRAAADVVIDGSAPLADTAREVDVALAALRA
jgi:dephospho-CoA kinase